MAANTTEAMQEFILLEELLLEPFTLWANAVSTDVKAKYKDFFDIMTEITDNGVIAPYNLSLDTSPDSLALKEFIQNKLDTEELNTKFLIVTNPDTGDINIHCNAKGMRQLENWVYEFQLQHKTEQPMRYTVEDFNRLFEKKEHFTMTLNEAQKEKLLQQRDFAYAFNDKTNEVTILKEDFVHLEHNKNNDLMNTLLQAKVNAHTAKSHNAIYEAKLKDMLLTEKTRKRYIVPMEKGDYYLRTAKGVVELIGKEGPVRGMKLDLNEFEANKANMSDLEITKFYGKLNQMFEKVPNPMEVASFTWDRIAEKETYKDANGREVSIGMEEFIEDHLYTGDITDFIQDKNGNIPLNKIGRAITEENAINYQSVSKNNLENAVNLNEYKEIVEIWNKANEEVGKELNYNEITKKISTQQTTLLSRTLKFKGGDNLSDLQKEIKKIERDYERRNESGKILITKNDMENIDYLQNNPSFANIFDQMGNSDKEEVYLQFTNAHLFEDPKDEILTTRILDAAKDKVILREKNEVALNILQEFERGLRKVGVPEDSLNNAMTKLNETLNKNIYSQKHLIAEIDNVKEKEKLIESLPITEIAKQNLQYTLQDAINNNNLDDRINKKYSTLEQQIEALEQHINKDQLSQKAKTSLEKREDVGKDILGQVKETLNDIKEKDVVKFYDSHGMVNENKNRTDGGEFER